MAKKTKEKQIIVRITAKELEAVKRQSEKNNLTLSEYVRLFALMEYEIKIFNRLKIETLDQVKQAIINYGSMNLRLLDLLSCNADVLQALYRREKQLINNGQDGNVNAGSRRESE